LRESIFAQLPDSTLNKLMFKSPRYSMTEWD